MKYYENPYYLGMWGSVALVFILSPIAVITSMWIEAIPIGLWIFCAIKVVATFFKKED